jgi:hypothetical protein
MEDIMKTDELLEQAKKDLEYDKTNLQSAIHEIPIIFGRWIDYHVAEKIKLIRMQRRMNDLRKEKWLYYSGKASPEVYKKRPFGLKLLKADVERFIDTDEEISSLQADIDLQNEKVYLIDEVSREIKSRQWQINSLIKWNEYLSGK